VLISDTHNKHEELGELPAGDVLIHAGDFAESAHPPKPQVRNVTELFARGQVLAPIKSL
jgi:predicted phosphodiesterase